ncbi:MAG TPA: hypothetical protein VL688_05470 [Verrucomicrobiae bacterium]|jgi:hypothetical protein|nr:hypothetical protein [Verrucomicrobiae bacterium]
MVPADEKKLKRGLKDVSQLFNGPSPGVLETRENEMFIKMVGIYNPGDPGDALFLNGILAALVSTHYPSSILTVGERAEAEPKTAARPLPSATPHLGLPWDEFDKIRESPIHRHYSGSSPRHVMFINADFSQTARLPRVVPLLDKCLLLVRPDLESLMEAYKFVKGVQSLNPRLQYFLIFEGASQGESGCFLFEKFSSLLARRLGVGLVWLGYLDPYRDAGRRGDELELEHLFLKDISSGEIPEKIALLELMTLQWMQLASETAS